MQVSQRLKGLTGGGSDGWEIFYRAREMIAEGIEVIELTIGEHDIRTAPAILAAMDASARGGHTGYAMVPGVKALREKVAARMTAQSGVPTYVENVLITPGGQAGLFAAHAAALDPGDVGLYLDPYYATYPGTIRGTGAEAVSVKTRAEVGFCPEFRDLNTAPTAKSLLINTPNNPTGVVYRQDTLETIAAFCQDRDLWLISDEVYDTQVWEGAHLSPRALPGMVDRTLVVGSMSKSHAMTGSRVGWVVGPAEAIEHMINLATHTTYGVAGFVQDAALYALNQGPEFEAEVAAPFRRRRDLVLHLLESQQLVRVVPSGGAMYLMLDIRGTGLSGVAFAEKLLAENHIAVMPGESFGQAAAGHIRLALTVDDRLLVQSVERLLAFAAAQVT